MFGLKYRFKIVPTGCQRELGRFQKRNCIGPFLETRVVTVLSYFKGHFFLSLQ